MGGAGIVTITGPNSEWYNTGSQLYVGNSQSGTLTVADGGALRVGSGTGVITVGLGAAGGTINIGAAEGDSPEASGEIRAGTVDLLSLIHI